MDTLFSNSLPNQQSSLVHASKNKKNGFFGLGCHHHSPVLLKNPRHSCRERERECDVLNGVREKKKKSILVGKCDVLTKKNSFFHERNCRKDVLT